MVEQVSVRVREARPEDYEAIGDLTAAAYAIYPEIEGDDGYMRELRGVAARAAACPIYAAVDADGHVLGGAMYVPGPGNPHAEVERDGEAGIRMLAVAPEAQGRGAGRALLDALIARARSDGRSGIALLTLASMTKAHRLYESAGFRRDPGRDWEYEPGKFLRCYALTFDDRDGG
jgi:ribosomal protein S18 acetylase RimI-like enzyme